MIPSKPGMTTPQMVEAAQSGKLKALYVMGANPLTHFGTLGFGRGNLELLIVQELFPTDTSRPGGHRFPGCIGLRKRRHGHEYRRRNSIFAQGCRSYGHAQRLRSAADPVAPTRQSWDSAKRFTTGRRTPSLKKFAKPVQGYDVAHAGLLTGGAELTHTHVSRNGHAPYDVPVGVIRPAQDTLFTSGTLGRFCTMMDSLTEADAKL